MYLPHSSMDKKNGMVHGKLLAWPRHGFNLWLVGCTIQEFVISISQIFICEDGSQEKKIPF